MLYRHLFFVALLSMVSSCSDSSDPQETDTGLAGDVADQGDGEEDVSEPITAPQIDSLKLTVDGPILRDSLGRQVILRGVNAGGRSKLPPFFPFPFSESGDPLQGDAPAFDDALVAYVDRIEEWGMNAVRLPFTWDAVEPTRGEYSDEFVERYRAMASEMGSRGIRVIVDFHQDVFARPFCGDGFPIWAIEGDVPERPENCGQWFLGYLNPGPVRDNFDRFWANEDGLRDAFDAMWTHMVGELWAVDGVIGFEILNEPGEGNGSASEWARTVLTPFYSETAALIHSIAPEAIVLFDATGLDAVAAETNVERPEGERLVFAPHFYDPAVILGGTPPTNPDFSEALGRWAAKGSEWNLPVLVGEFGSRRNIPDADVYIRANYDAFDLHLLHATLWEYSATEDEWNDEGMSILNLDGTESVIVAAAVRVYPSAISGTLSEFQFDGTTRLGSVSFDGLEGTVSEIAVPTALYPEGLTTTCEGPARVRHDIAGRRLLIEQASDGVISCDFGPTD